MVAKKSGNLVLQFSRFFIPLFFFSLPAFAREGGASHGGGNPKGSRVSEINAALALVSDHEHRIGDSFNLQDAFRKIHDRWRFDVSFQKKNPELRPLLDRFFGQTPDFEFTAINRDLSNTRYEMISGSCRSDFTGKGKAASTAMKLGSPICLSAPLLTRVPSHALKEQLRALLAHEFAHHFGFGEKEAILLQNFLLEDSVENPERSKAYTALRIRLLMSEMQVKDLLSATGSVSAPTSDSALCLKMGELAGFLSRGVLDALDDAAEKGEGNLEGNANFRELRRSAQSIFYGRMARLIGFCGGTLVDLTSTSDSHPALGLLPVPFGDRVALKASLKGIAGELRALFEQIDRPY